MQVKREVRLTLRARLKINMNIIDIMRNRIKHDFYHIINYEENKYRKYIYQQYYNSIHQTNKVCLVPGCKCTPINSHELSKKAVLDQFSTSSNVYVINVDYAENMNKRKLVKRSKIKTTTFPGFCKKHDNNLFKTLDNPKNGIDINYVQEQFFRTLSKEYWKLQNKNEVLKVCTSQEFIESLIDEKMYNTIYSLLKIEKTISKENAVLSLLSYKEQDPAIIKLKEELEHKLLVTREELNRLHVNAYSSSFSKKKITNIYQKYYEKLIKGRMRIDYVLYEVESILLFSYIGTTRFNLAIYEIHIFCLSGRNYLLISSNCRIFINYLKTKSNVLIEKMICQIINSNFTNIILPYDESISDHFAVNCILENYTYGPINEVLEKPVKIKNLTLAST